MSDRSPSNTRPAPLGTPPFSDMALLLEGAADGIVSLDLQHRCVYANSQAERLLGHPRAELQGGDIFPVFAEAFAENFAAALQQALTAQTAAVLEDYDPARDTWLEGHLTPASTGTVLHFRDISPQRRAQQRAEQLLTVSTALGGAITTRQVTNVIIEAALPIFQADMGLVALLSEDGSRLDSAQIVGVSSEEADAWRSFPADAPVPLADAVRERRLIVLLSDEEHHAAYPEMAEKRAVAGTGALVVVPLLVGERCIGGIGLICPPERCRAEEQQTFLRTLAGQCALALERARLYDAERQAREDALTEVAERRLTEEALEKSGTRFRALADNIAQLAWMAEADGSIFWYNRRWFDFTGTTWEEMQGWGWRKVHHPDYVERVTEKFREYVRTEHVWEDTFPLRGKDGEYRWFLSRAFPIRDDNGRVALWCGTNTDVTEQRDAQAMLATAYQRELLLNRIGQAIRGTSDPDKIQGVAVRALGEALGADRAYFNLVDMPGDKSWVGQDYRRDDLPSLAGDYRISDYQIDPLAFYPEGRTLVLPDVQTWDWPQPLADAVRSMRVRSAINVPLFDDNLLVGTLAVAMADEPRAWQDDEVALVETVAVQTRAALEAVRAQEREHRIASDLQDALQPRLPDTLPGLVMDSFTRPALDEASVGGDFFDVFPLDKELYAIVIGDVSGKGLAAAQQLALIRNSLRTTLYLYRAPAQAAASLNTIVTAHDLLVGFVTAFVSVYDAATGQVTYCSCGHEPGLVRRAATGAVEEMETTGLPLGVAENADYGERAFTLNRGDTLLLYTDGISESGPSRRELLGTAGLTRLFASLPSHENIRSEAIQLVEAVSEQALGIFRDDVCMLLARRE